MHVLDSDFDLPAELPFPPGTSPFRQKGNVYLGNVDCFADTIPGGINSVLKGLTNDKIRAFFEQRFHADEWYDSIPNPYLQAVAAHMRHMPFFEHGRTLGAWHAKSRMTGIYGALLKVLSNENVAIWAPRLSSVYYSFGKLNTRVIGPRRVAISRPGVPKILVRWLTAVMTGMGEQTLRLAGAKEVQVTLLQVSPDGTFSGCPLYKIDGEISWALIDLR